MTRRRQLLRGVVGTLSVFGGLRWGGLVAPADAQSSDTGASDSDASGDSDNGSDADDEDDPTGLPGYTVGQIYLRYEEHVGITTFIELENDGEQHGERVKLKADAASPNTTLGTDDTWQKIPATFERTVKLRLDNVFDLYNAIDNISEFVIRGRLPDGEYAVLAAFSGRAFRKGIETDGPATPDGGADAAVEVQPETSESEPDTEPADGGDADTTTDDTSTEPAPTEPGDVTPDPRNQTGVDVSDPEDVVNVGRGDDDSENNDSGGGGLLESLSFGVFGG